jgi:long-chain acyl-CoA synthetase
MSELERAANLVDLFHKVVLRRNERPFLWAKRDGSYRALSWQRVAEQAHALAKALSAKGLRRGDRVLLVAENRPEWLIADLAIMSAGGITVPAYTTNTSHDHAYLLQHSGASAVVVSNGRIAKRVLPALAEAPEVRLVIAMEPLEDASEVGIEVLEWRAALALGEQQPDAVSETVAALSRDDVACFIYTSGTGGLPKGVMLTHGNMLCNCMGAYELLRSFGLGDEVFLSFLPLSHSYEHTVGQFFPMSIGAQIYYGEGAEHLLANLAEARPTIMTAVPRLYETMHQRLCRTVDKQGGWRKRLFYRAVELGRKRLQAPRSLSLAERVEDAVLERLVRDQMRKRFGGRLKAMVSGGAALNPDIGLFFTALGLRVLQGYGQTEAAPTVSCNPPHRVKMETVGRPLEGVEVRLAEDGEILVRGELIMKGYWGDEALTRATVRDGWLHTGDIGAVDLDGYLRITDRKKDIIVLSGGDNVSPARIEGCLTLQAEIGQAMVYGDKRPHLVAVIVPDEEFLAALARGRPGGSTELAEDRDLRAALSAAVERANQELSVLERIRRFIIASEPFTVGNEMMTPTLKIRRHKIKQVYQGALEALYQKQVGELER